MNTGGPADSAGLPWQGRTVTGTAFPGDTGTADPRLVAALEAYSAFAPGAVGVSADEGTSPGPEPEVHRSRNGVDGEFFAALAGARVLVPIVATPVSTTVTADGHVADNESDMATVVLTGPDGTRALPVFTSVGTLAAWDRTARPVPVSSADAARAATEEGCAVMLLDLGSEPDAVVATSMLWALAQRRAWLPGHLDPVVREAVQRATVAIPEVGGVASASGDGGATVVTIALTEGLAGARVQEILQQIAIGLSTDEVRVRLDRVSFRVRPRD